MHAKAVGVLLLLGLLSSPFVHIAQGQVFGSSSIPASLLGMGFSSTSVQPVSEQVPVYTVGDQIWFEYYGIGEASVTILAPPLNTTLPANGTTYVTLLGVPGQNNGAIVRGTAMIPVTVVAQEAPDLLYTFSATDVSGVYGLAVESQGNLTVVPFEVVSEGSGVSLQGYGVQGDGELTLNYTLTSTSAYHVAGCLVGTLEPHAVNVPVPISFGGGDLSVSLNYTNVSVEPRGVHGSFNFSLALTQAYAYTLNQTSAIVSRDVRVGVMPSVDISPSTESILVALELRQPMRPGAFALSASFGSGSGAAGYQTQVLVTGTGPWISMQGCYGAAAPTSRTVSLQSSLNSPFPDWPRYAYLTYDYAGIPTYAVVGVVVQPAVAGLESPEGPLLTDSQVAATGAPGLAVGDGHLYVASQQYPVNVSLQDPQGFSGPFEVSQPYNSSEFQIPAGELIVDTLSNGAPVSGVQVVLTDTEGLVDAINSTDGQAVFYVPPGNYTVSGALSGSNGSATASLGAPGQTTQVSLDFQVGGQPASLLLTVTAIAGAVASVSVWTVVYMRRK